MTIKIKINITSNVIKSNRIENGVIDLNALIIWFIEILIQTKNE